MKTIGILSAVFVSLFSILNRDTNFLRNIIDSTFILGFIYIIISMIFYVRNIGLFKTFSYNNYKKTVRKNNKEIKEINNNYDSSKNNYLEGIDPTKEDMLEFHEFCEENYAKQWSSKKFIIFGLAMLTTSLLLLIVSYKLKLL